MAMTKPLSAQVRFTQEGAGAVERLASEKLRELVTPEDFGAVGDGVADDTSAMTGAILSLAAGGELRLGFGKTYLISQTIVLTKPVRITGGARENTKIIFSSSGAYLAAPYRCGILALHSLTTVPGYSGDARRSSLCGFTLEMQPGPAGLGGLIAACPIYVNEVDANKFSGDGFSVIAGSGSPIQGNANGSTFTNCSALQNGGSGFFLIGDDANACVFTGARAYVNGAWGFFDSSLLGNTYIGCETDLNTQGAYYSDSAKPNRSVYVGCYAEGNQPVLWFVNPRCLRIGSLGALDNANGSPGISLTSLPSKNLYLNNPLVLADTEDVANALSGGEFTQIGKDGFRYKRDSGRGLRVRQFLSTNYVDIESDGAPSIRFPNSAVFGNVAPARPLFESGLSIGGGGRSAIVGGGTAAPTSGTYDLGAIFLNDAPIAGGFVGWVCVSAGSPGVWKTFGAISA